MLPTAGEALMLGKKGKSGKFQEVWPQETRMALGMPGAASQGRAARGCHVQRGLRKGTERPAVFNGEFRQRPHSSGAPATQTYSNAFL